MKKLISLVCLIVLLTASMTFAGSTIRQVLSGVTAVNDGVWVEWVTSSSDAEGSVVVTGITTATVQVRVSNSITLPANSYHGIQLGPDITQDDGMLITGRFRWVKVMVSAYTSGTIDANLLKFAK